MTKLGTAACGAHLYAKFVLISHDHFRVIVDLCMAGRTCDTSVSKLDIERGNEEGVVSSRSQVTHVLLPSFALFAEPPGLTSNRDDVRVVREIFAVVPEELDQQFSHIVLICTLPHLRQVLQVVKE